MSSIAYAVPVTRQQTRTIVKTFKLIEKDRNRDDKEMSSLISKCLNQGVTLQQVETVLRKNRCYTYLIANTKTPPPNTTVSLPDGTAKIYYLFVSTKDEEYAMQELLQFSSSYEENFQKLAETGLLIKA